jgi:hypothetical protein
VKWDGVGHLRVVEHSLLKYGVLLVAALVCVAAALDYLEMPLATLKKHWRYSADQTSVVAQEWPVMHMTFVSQDAVYPHMCSGNRLETYADTPAVVCALKVAEREHQSVPLEPAHTAASVQQVSAIHNLLQVLLVAVLSAIIVREAYLPAAMAEISTVVVASHTCTGCATSEMQDPVMYTNLLLLQQVYFLNRAV